MSRAPTRRAGPGRLDDLRRAYEIEQQRSEVPITLHESDLEAVSGAVLRDIYRLGTPRARRVDRRYRVQHDRYDRVVLRDLHEHQLGPLANRRYRRLHGRRPGGENKPPLLAALNGAGDVETFIKADISGCFPNADVASIVSLDCVSELAAPAQRLLKQLPGVWAAPFIYGLPENVCLSHSLAEVALQEIDAFVLGREITPVAQGRETNSHVASRGHLQARPPSGGRIAHPAISARSVARPPLRCGEVSLYHRHKDDILIGLVGGRAEAQALVADIGVVAERFGWRISHEKQEIAEAHVGVDHVGIHVSVVDTPADRSERFAVAPTEDAASRLGGAVVLWIEAALQLPADLRGYVLYIHLEPHFAYLRGLEADVSVLELAELLRTVVPGHDLEPLLRVLGAASGDKGSRQTAREQLLRSAAAGLQRSDVRKILHGVAVDVGRSLDL